MVFTVMLRPCKTAPSWPRLLLFLLMATCPAHSAEWVQRPAPSGAMINLSASPPPPSLKFI